jgi:hypothetical protein
VRDDNNYDLIRRQQDQEFEDDLQIVIEKLIHALAIVLRRKIHKWIRRKDNIVVETAKEDDKTEEEDDDCIGD